MMRARGNQPRIRGRTFVAGTRARCSRPSRVVCGGADALAEPQLTVARRTLGPAIAAAAALTGAVVVDGGTAAGVMALVGAERARDPAAISVLLGVAPAGRVAHAGASGDGRTALEPNHTHIVLADSDEWGGETALLMALAEELAHGAPVVMVLAGGGEGTRAELREGIARGWPLFVIEGTGGVADEVAGTLRGGHRGESSGMLAELKGGDVRPVAGNGPDGLARSLEWELHDEPALKDAWQLFATYDGLAGRLRIIHLRFQRWILLLGVVATAVALLYDEVLGWGALHALAVATPVVASVLITLSTQRAAGERWVLLRAAAEATKSEIYRYRTQTGVYSEQALSDGEADHAPGCLVVRLAEIEGKVVQSAASGAAIPSYRGPLPPEMYGAEAGDDGLSALDGPRYVEIRVADQLTYYRGKVVSLDRRRNRLRVLTVVSGGAGTLVAAAGFDVWIGLTTAIGGAALAYLSSLQFDTTIVAYNQTVAQLAALEREFGAGSDTLALEDLVRRGEGVLTTELGGWVQQMTEALEQQKAQQSKAAQGGGTQDGASGP